MVNESRQLIPNNFFHYHYFLSPISYAFLVYLIVIMDMMDIKYIALHAQYSWKEMGQPMHVHVHRYCNEKLYACHH